MSCPVFMFPTNEMKDGPIYESWHLASELGINLCHVFFPFDILVTSVFILFFLFFFFFDITDCRAIKILIVLNFYTSIPNVDLRK